MRAYQDSVGETFDDVLNDADGGELDGADVAHEADGDEADGELEDGREDGREGDVPQQLRLLPALAQRRLPLPLPPDGHAGRRRRHVQLLASWLEIDIYGWMDRSPALSQLPLDLSMSYGSDDRGREDACNGSRRTH